MNEGRQRSAGAQDGIADRKRGHLEAVLSADVAARGVTTGLERWRLVPRALPGRDLADVDTTTRLLGRSLRAPLLVSCMTGGVAEAGAVNRSLAVAAQHHGVALGLGSARALLVDPRASSSFTVRDVAPDVLLLANLGAVQLHEYTVDACAHVVDVCGADALVLHLNAVQEAVQAGGDTAFGGLVERIAATVAALDVPVVVKEVGFGLSDADIRDLLAAGVAGIDVAGAGGTNWARVEGQRSDASARLAAAFADWGRPTADCVRAARRLVDADTTSAAVVIGSGGIRDGVDALKVLCLGADAAGMARGLLRAGAAGPEAATTAIGDWCDQLRIAMWATGAGSLDEVGTGLLERVARA